MTDPKSESSEHLPEDLKPFEALLGSFLPAPSRIDRDRLMYAAGGAAASVSSQAPAHRSRQWLWPSVSAALLLLSATLGVALALRGDAAERIVYVDRPVATPSVASATRNSEASGPVDTLVAKALDGERADDFRLPPESNFMLRERALRFGVDAIEPPRHSTSSLPAPDYRNRSLLNQMLGS
jgi:hypothetical protein